MLVPPSIVSDPALFIVIVIDPLILNLISSPSVAELVERIKSEYEEAFKKFKVRIES